MVWEYVGLKMFVRQDENGIDWEARCWYENGEIRDWMEYVPPWRQSDASDESDNVITESEEGEYDDMPSLEDASDESDNVITESEEGEYDDMPSLEEGDATGSEPYERAVGNEKRGAIEEYLVKLTKYSTKYSTKGK